MSRAGRESCSCSSPLSPAWGPRRCEEHGVAFLADGCDLASLVADDLRRSLPWSTAAEHDRVGRIRRAQGAVAERHGATKAAVALAWMTRQARTHAIVGARTPGEAETMLALPTLSAAALAAAA